ncbi:cysteine rich repeat-containing protein, partial [Bradyrhizobium yuanmingense]
MFKRLKHASTRAALLATALFATATGAFAQTEAQKSTIRSACRSDFMAHCSSVTPGGVEAYQCLAKNMSSLSSGCQAAVRAVEPAAAPKTEAAPAKSEPAKSEPAKSEPAKT